MEVWLHALVQDWLSLLLRWAHMVTGIAWIGASFYFNWLENQLERRQDAADPLAGDLWAVHGGGFYYLQKFRVAPTQMPAHLHWFKYEAYATWLTGFCLLMVVFWWNAPLFLINPENTLLSAPLAIGLSFSVLLLSWLLYHGLCSSTLAKNGVITALLIFAWFTFLAWFLGDYFTGRATYLHVGAAIGTVMVANVFFVIIPAQKNMVSALTEGREPDGKQGERALQRSRHNNYLTLPVLFIMISSHYPFTYGSQYSWLILLILSLALVGIRHWFNVRHLPQHNRWILPLSLMLLLALIVASLPKAPKLAGDSSTMAAAPGLDEIRPLIELHCAGCHAANPAFGGFVAPPLGVMLETDEQIVSQSQRIQQVVVVSQTMPLGNLQGMTLEQRELVGQWYAGLSLGDPNLKAGAE